MARSTQRTFGDWELPKGTRLSSGNFIREEVSGNTDGDEPGAWAQNILNLYEFLKPPLIQDSWAAPYQGVGAADTYETVGRYMVPGDVIGTDLSSGGSVEGLRSVFWARAETSGTTSVRTITVDENSLPATTASATFTELAIGKTDLQTRASGDPANDREVLVQAKNSVAGSQGRVAALFINWHRNDASLPAGPYSSVFRPQDLADYVANKPLSVQQMQQFAVNLQDLWRRRTPGMIHTAWSQTGMDNDGQGNLVRFRGLGFQYEGVSRARAWVYCKGDGSGTQEITVTLGDQTAVIGLGEGLTTSFAWLHVDFDLTPHYRQNPDPQDFLVAVADGVVQGACAWYRPIEVE